MGLGSALLRARTRVAVLGVAGLGRKDVKRVLSRTLVRTLLLRNFGRTGPTKNSLSLLVPRTRAAHSGGERERNCAL